MADDLIHSRRGFLHAASAGLALSAWCSPAHGKEPEEEEIAPAEDLMREHGVLNRILLVYEEVDRRIRSRQDFSPDSLKKAAQIIREFIENYHENLEEEFLFPRFEKAHQQVELVQTLKAQHQAGRRLTDVVLRLSSAALLKEAGQQRELATTLRQFVRMYRPHEAREDTVLFPALRKIVSRNEYAALGEDFEKREHKLFGEGGFERMVEKVAEIEKDLGIFELAQFTPQ